MISLEDSTLRQPVDRVLRGLVGVFETAFPGWVRAYFLTSSQADGSVPSTSDIDLRVV